MSKHNFNSSMSMDNKGSNNSFYYGTVVSNLDEDLTKRIVVRIDGVDDGINTENLPKAFPLLPKMYGITPKIGETVIIFLQDLSNTRTDRFYIGPIVSQPQFINNSDLTTATAALPSSHAKLNMSPKLISDAKGVYNDNNDLVLEGRNNADIVFDKNEIKIRVGKFSDDEKKENIPLFNFKNPTFIQLRHNASINNSKIKFSMINMVSDKIFLLTHEKGNPSFGLNDQDKQISDDELLKILETAHPVPFGDKLVEFLLLLKEVVLNHSHPYPGMKAFNLNGENSINKLNEFDVTSILSKNIKIN